MSDFNDLVGSCFQAKVSETTSTPEVAETSDNQGISEDKHEQNENEDAAAPPRRRNTRRET